MSNIYSCPKCGTSNRVKKVQVIFDTLPGTPLAGKMMPPPKPQFS